MTVCCPHCSTTYELPDHLMGKRGARVTCPTCGEGFTVTRLGPDERSAGESAPANATPGEASRRDRAVGAAALSAVESELTVWSHLPGSGVERAAPARDPALVADEVLEVLERFLGESLARSRQRGTVLSEHGPMIVAVWDEYRRRLGTDASAVAFRSVLRDRCGVDLNGAQRA